MKNIKILTMSGLKGIKAPQWVRLSIVVSHWDLVARLLDWIRMSFWGELSTRQFGGLGPMTRSDSWDHDPGSKSWDHDLGPKSNLLGNYHSSGNYWYCWSNEWSWLHLEDSYIYRIIGFLNFDLGLIELGFWLINWPRSEKKWGKRGIQLANNLISQPSPNQAIMWNMTEPQSINPNQVAQFTNRVWPSWGGEPNHQIYSL